MTDTQIKTPNPLTEQALDIPLAHAGGIKRTIAAPLIRVWENVYDWEHLPHLHDGSFSKCTLEASGPWGWRTHTRGVPDDPAQADSVVELVADKAAGHYVSRIIAGPNAGMEIWTGLQDKGDATHIDVRFLVPAAPDTDQATLDFIGEVMTQLYTKLWDEDEAMMVARHHALLRPKRASQTIPLGTHDHVHANLPMSVKTDLGPVHIDMVDRAGTAALTAWLGVCPHLLGPLDHSCRSGAQVTCPWHGYRFDLHDGTQVDGNLAMKTRCTIKRDGDELVLEIAARD